MIIIVYLEADDDDNNGDVEKCISHVPISEPFMTTLQRKNIYTQ